LTTARFILLGREHHYVVDQSYEKATRALRRTAFLICLIPAATLMQWPLARRRPRTFQNFNLAAVMGVLRDLGESRPGKSASIRSENDPSQLGKVAGWGRRQDLHASWFKAGMQTGNASPPASVPQTDGKVSCKFSS
jgi:hypothetical protein